ncbi:hypothetical protein K438DRAFT_1758174 [Mycena galopus ATCC 62051]|nr:hypothetical protein K438DRAFT_1758174 [Mycena galopus ATCC 62051]
MLEDLQKATFSPRIGTWIILNVSPESESLLVDLGRLCSQRTFPCNLCRMRSSPTTSSARALPRDSPRRSCRPKHVAPNSTQIRAVEKPILPSGSVRSQESTTHASSKLTAEALLQLVSETVSICSPINIFKGRARAVEKDSTLIVFNCGNYERIGVRHRETQTLYLSDLIDVPCKDPGDLKIQVGIYKLTSDTISRAKDAERAPAPSEMSPHRGSRKRPSTLILTEGKAKHPKTAHEEDSNDQTATSLAGKCSLTLLHLDYEFYHSPTPASFTRSAPCLATSTSSESSSPPLVKRSYQRHEYFNAEAGEAIIIDFDRGRFNPIDVKKPWEMDIMKGSLRGKRGEQG